MQIKIFDITNILAFGKKWDSFAKNSFKILDFTIEHIEDETKLIVYYDDKQKCNTDELKFFKEPQRVCERKVNSIFEESNLLKYQISLVNKNRFLCVILISKEE